MSDLTLSINQRDDRGRFTSDRFLAKKAISVRLPQSYLEQLTLIVDRENVTATQLVRSIVESWLDEQPKEN